MGSEALHCISLAGTPADVVTATTTGTATGATLSITAVANAQQYEVTPVFSNAGTSTMSTGASLTPVLTLATDTYYFLVKAVTSAGVTSTTALRVPASGTVPAGVPLVVTGATAAGGVGQATLSSFT